jgi:cobalamin biosynthesis Mg chelatase CobN
MLGMRQVPVPVRSRSLLALSMLALLAFCCLPAFADASGAGYQYQDAPPTATGGPPSESNISPGSKSTSGAGSQAHKNGSAQKGSSGDQGSSAKNGGGSGSGKVNSRQGSQGQAGGGSAEKAKPVSSTEPGSSGGGSSSLVWILIAIALLAAGSIAYLAIRRRRGEGDGTDAAGPPDSPGSADSSVSPEAG